MRGPLQSAYPPRSKQRVDGDIVAPFATDWNIADQEAAVPTWQWVDAVNRLSAAAKSRGRRHVHPSGGDRRPL